MAKITTNQLVFGNNTSINSKYDVVAQNVRMVFYASSAPTGWTTENINEHAIRVITSTGGSTGGSVNFTDVHSLNSINVNVPITLTDLSVGDTTLGIPQIPAHGHGLGNSGSGSTRSPSPFVGSSTRRGTSGGTTGPIGGGGAHSHPISYSSATTGTNISADMRIRYANVLICKRA
jgi:hypothetical protein